MVGKLGHPAKVTILSAKSLVSLRMGEWETEAERKLELTIDPILS